MLFRLTFILLFSSFVYYSFSQEPEYTQSGYTSLSIHLSGKIPGELPEITMLHVSNPFVLDKPTKFNVVNDSTMILSFYTFGPTTVYFQLDKHIRISILLPNQQDELHLHYTDGKSYTIDYQGRFKELFDGSDMFYDAVRESISSDYFVAFSPATYKTAVEYRDDILLSKQPIHVTIIDSVHPAYRGFLLGIDTLGLLSMSREEANTHLMKKSTELYELRKKIIAGEPNKRLAYFEGQHAISRFEEVKIRLYIAGITQLPYTKKTALEIDRLGFFARSSGYNITPLLKEVFYSFPDEIQQSAEGKNTWALLTRYEHRVGENLHTFEQQKLIDTARKPLDLKTMIDTSTPYKIIFFGASWCASCRTREHLLKSWHHLLDTSQVAIVNVSVDKDEQAWLKSVIEDELPWPSYMLPDYNKTALYQHFKLDEGIPRVLLLDAENNILFEHSDIRQVVSKLPFMRYEMRI